MIRPVQEPKASDRVHDPDDRRLGCGGGRHARRDHGIEVRKGWPADRLLGDPDGVRLGIESVEECIDLGAMGGDRELDGLDLFVHLAAVLLETLGEVHLELRLQPQDPPVPSRVR